MAELGLKLATFPSASFPEVLGDSAELEAAYRFLGNEDVDAEDILEPHRTESLARCREHPTIVVAHDTTDITYSSERRGLGRTTGSQKNGYLAHVAFAVTPTEIHEPLGVLHLESWVRGPKQPKKHPRKRREDPDRESLRWRRGVTAVEELLEENHAIHVMDREADDYDLLSALVDSRQRFVIRSRTDRRLVGDDAYVRAHATAQPIRTTRDVPLSERRRLALPKSRKAHPLRHARTATLGLKASVISLRRPDALPASLPPQLSIHVVLVEEQNPPAGETPISWLLYTTEPIKTAADLERVVDFYRCRWTVEEFFKALKTGCAIEKRQLESYHSLVNALAIYIPIAWRVLRHRSLARAIGEAPASAVLSELQLKILRKKSRRPLSKAPTVDETLTAIAGIGGHLKRNGAPGWLTIARGYEKLLNIEEGVRIALEM